MGDNHELLPLVLNEFAATAATVDFVLVDGDHSAEGVRRDLEDLLASPSTEHTVIMIHDTINERVRAGLEEIPWDAFDTLSFVDLDFLVGPPVSRGGVRGAVVGRLRSCRHRGCLPRTVDDARRQLTKRRTFSTPSSRPEPGGRPPGGPGITKSRTWSVRSPACMRTL